MRGISVLVVDDEKLQRETLAQILKDHGVITSIAQDVDEAKAELEKHDFDIVLSDLRMPGGSGLDVARFAVERHPEVFVLVMTAYADVQGVIEAMRAGVADYLLKPLNVDQLIKKIEFLKERRALQLEVNSLRIELNRARNEGRLKGDSPAMNEVRKVISQVSATKGTVLITGESGTGKEVAARQIHMQSAQKHKSFVAINCGAIPENLLESELFGHMKGSFTGAVSDKVGLFVTADGGTLFLDEIGELPKNLQVKLLRAIQEREIMPVGAARPIKIDVRLVAATNRDLAADVEKGAFRQDLFYRINVVEIKMPPLREHTSDIAPLVTHIIARFSREMGKPIQGLSPEALKRLLTYRWPGNVRELENVLERALILKQSGNFIEVADLPAGFQNTTAESNSMILEDAVSRFTREHITKTLEFVGGDKKEAAKILGMGLSSLYRKLEELEISTKKAES